MASGYSDLSEITRGGQFYGLHQKPAKIDLLAERPRRESVVEQQLADRIERPVFDQHQQQVDEFNQRIIQGNNIYQVQGSHRTTPAPIANPNLGAQHTNWATTSIPTCESTRMATQTYSNRHLIAYSELVNDLAQKEVKLRSELAYVNQHLANPWARPPQVREPRREPEARVSCSQQRWVKEIPPSSHSSRPTSRASSTRSTTEADLMQKAEQLLKDVEELERKPIKTQQVLIESGAGAKQHGAGTSSTSTSTNGSIHTAIVNVPAIEPDNKSPLPFAFDNFSTLGVRGNIASVGAAEPDKPYPPIYPIVKRTPTPRR